MYIQIKIQLRLIKFFIISIFSFLFASCENIILDGLAEQTNQDNSSTDCSAESYCKIFISNSTYTGNLGGTSGADSKCMSDANNPGDGTYKAMLTSTSRLAFPATDWVLQATKEYRRTDETTVIGTTGAYSTFEFQYSSPLTNSMSASSEIVWTGLYGPYDSWIADNNCTDWTTDSSGFEAKTGNSGSTFTPAIDSGNQYCDSTRKIVCVQQ